MGKGERGERGELGNEVQIEDGKIRRWRDIEGREGEEKFGRKEMGGGRWELRGDVKWRREDGGKKERAGGSGV